MVVLPLHHLAATVATKAAAAAVGTSAGVTGDYYPFLSSANLAFSELSL